MTEAVDTLRKARELIQEPARWTQHAEARDRQGASVSPLWDDACQWCAWGAAWRAYHASGARGDVWFAAIDTLEASVEEHVPRFNDRHSHAEVLAAFDRAIAALEGKPC